MAPKYFGGATENELISLAGFNAMLFIDNLAVAYSFWLYTCKPRAWTAAKMILVLFCSCTGKTWNGPPSTSTAPAWWCTIRLIVWSFLWRRLPLRRRRRRQVPSFLIGWVVDARNFPPSLSVFCRSCCFVDARTLAIWRSLLTSALISVVRELFVYTGTAFSFSGWPLQNWQILWNKT